MEALKEFPDARTNLKTKKGQGFYQKAEVFSRMIWYSYEEDESYLIALPLEKVKMIIDMNAKGDMPERLEDFAMKKEKKSDFQNAADLFDMDRFDER